eukprot:CAMPEP_0172311486 /NCGR_PEP_ID=MMETSP1058-20130122/14870_1 /TAXON_ID=83371 /ORGANISM="Detonula confervacea, Strain CCMP 353" /LENGTH=205 /DNA_ID=CAMNT_0013024673 /DNA_START=147 /DNA_END=765 /DNA_ORIENTATION=+
MSDAESAPKSIAERKQLFKKKGNDNAPPPSAVVSNKNALAGRIAALQKNAKSTTGASGGVSKGEKPKVGKLKPPAGAVPMIPFGSGPHPSLLKKKKEREERMGRLQQEAKSSGGDELGGEKPGVGKLKLPSGAVPIMPFGSGPPPSLLKKQKEREDRMAKLQQEVKLSEDEVGASHIADENLEVEDALLSRPIIKGGKRRPRTRA